ncbi:IclR family transcriptional regulator [Methylobacterium terricola]|uniref:IclR family transcriptional regulator n=1 Tax=Methylobacterium terricola TaxID=2583531 RepID=A0A5C4L8J1_9HYPH|nr:IclR family transcriptional regulator [Methylobacterium terricola]TNC07165.1 IclR family transcriptional regulator [Methylobacterium terricola]
MANGRTRARPKVEGVASADRLLTVLTAFRRGDDALDLAELAARTDLVKSTIMRLCVSLERFGLIERIPDGRYRLGTEIARLGSVYLQSFALEAHVIPVLDRLVAASGETASFYIRRGEHRLCLFRVDSPSPLRMHVRPGDLRPMDESSIAQVLDRFDPVHGSARPVALPLFSHGVTDPHVSSCAVPVFGAGGRLVGALAISGPASRLTGGQVAAVAALLVESAATLTRTLGGDAGC